MRVKDMRLACPFCGGFFTVEMGEDKRFRLISSGRTGRGCLPGRKDKRVHR